MTTPGQLRNASTSLANAAGAWEDRAQTVGGAWEAARGATDDITTVWTSPASTDLQTSTRQSLDALREAPEVMDSVRSTLANLGNRAETLAERLATHLDAAEEARTSAARHREQLGSGMLEPDHHASVQTQHADAIEAANAAESRADGVRTEWDQACRTAAGTLEGDAHALLRQAVSTGVLDPAHVSDLVASAGSLAGFLSELFDGDLSAVRLSPEMAAQLADELLEDLDAILEEYGETPRDLHAMMDSIGDSYPAIAAALELIEAHADNPDFAQALVTRLGEDGIAQMFHLIDNVDVASNAPGGPPAGLESVDSTRNLDAFLSVLATASQTGHGRTVVRDFVSPSGEVGSDRIRHVSLMLTQPDYPSAIVADAAEFLLVTSSQYRAHGDLPVEIRSLHPDLQISAGAVAIHALAGDPLASADFLSRGTEHADAIVNPELPGWAHAAGYNPLWDTIDDKAGQVILNGLVNAEFVEGYSPGHVRRALDNVIGAAAENGVRDELQVVVAASVTPHMSAIEDKMAIDGHDYSMTFRDFVAAVSDGSPEAAAVLVDGAVASLMESLGPGVEQFLDVPDPETGHPGYPFHGQTTAFGEELGRTGVLDQVAAGIATGISDERDRQAAIIGAVQSGANGVSAVSRAAWLTGPKGVIVGIGVEQVVNYGAGLIENAVTSDLPPLDETIRTLESDLEPALANYLFEHHPELRDPANTAALGAGIDDPEAWANDPAVRDLVAELSRGVVGSTIDEVLIAIALDS